MVLKILPIIVPMIFSVYIVSIRIRNIFINRVPINSFRLSVFDKLTVIR